MASPDLAITPQSASMIPLSRASLCPSCDVVSDATGESCPACGHATGLLNLSTVLGTLHAERTTETTSTEGADFHGNSHA